MQDLVSKPSFWRLLAQQAWLLVKVLIPAALYVSGVIWLLQGHVIAMMCVLWGGVLLFMVGMNAWMTYRWKRNDYLRYLRNKEAEEQERVARIIPYKRFPDGPLN